jgi:hypothetical protein
MFWSQVYSPVRGAEGESYVLSRDQTAGRGGISFSRDVNRKQQAGARCTGAVEDCTVPDSVEN